MATDKLSLGDRMKGYERVWNTTLPGRMPVIIRLDGKAFHSYTHGAEKPFDDKLMKVMDEAAIEVMKEISGCMLSYVQSDEVSILINSYRSLNELPWFANELPKMLSVSAGMMSAHFTARSHEIFDKTKVAVFDSRVFVLPESDVNNYFIWRQRDCIRNSINTIAREYFSQKQLFKKNTDDVKKMLLEKDVDLEDQLAWEPYYTRGRCILKKPKEISPGLSRNVWTVDRKIPSFVEDRDYVSNFVTKED